MKLKQAYRTGLDYLETITDLLQRMRLEDPLAGLYEAADLQWWWREDDAAIPDRQTFWLDEEGNAVAALVLLEGGEAWYADLFVLSSRKADFYATHLSTVLTRLLSLSGAVKITVRDDDSTLRAELENDGFTQSPTVLVQAELERRPAPTELPADFTLRTRAEEREPHHLIRRNGEQVEARLRECSLYRPDLDLCIRHRTGEVAAYGLFWMDERTRIGLVEPIRTEEPYQRRGLAHHLIARGIAKLHGLGATSIRVTFDESNLGAARLYHGLDFIDRFRKLEYLFARE